MSCIRIIFHKYSSNSKSLMYLVLSIFLCQFDGLSPFDRKYTLAVSSEIPIPRIFPLKYNILLQVAATPLHQRSKGKVYLYFMDIFTRDSKTIHSFFESFELLAHLHFSANNQYNLALNIKLLFTVSCLFTFNHSFVVLNLAFACRQQPSTLHWSQPLIRQVLSTI